MVIDDDIDKQLDNAKQFVLSMQNSMRNLGSTLMLFDSMSIFGPQRSPRPRRAPRSMPKIRSGPWPSV